MTENAAFEIGDARNEFVVANGAVITGRVVHDQLAGQFLALGAAESEHVLSLEDHVTVDHGLSLGRNVASSPDARPRYGGDRDRFNDPSIAADDDVPEHPGLASDLGVTSNHGFRTVHDGKFMNTGIFFDPRSIEHHGVRAHVSGRGNPGTVSHETTPVGVAMAFGVFLQELDSSRQLIFNTDHATLQPMRQINLPRSDPFLSSIGSQCNTPVHVGQLTLGERADFIRQWDGNFVLHGVAQILVAVVERVKFVEIDHVTLTAMRRAGLAPAQGHLPRIARSVNAGEQDVAIPLG